MLKIPFSLSISIVVAMLFCGSGVAFSQDETDAVGPGFFSLGDERSSALAYFDLPMRVQAQFETTYTDGYYIADVLSRPYAIRFGPPIIADHALESRLALTRPISDKVEIGIVWGMRSRLRGIDRFDFDRQTVRAMIRIVP